MNLDWMDCSGRRVFVMIELNGLEVIFMMNCSGRLVFVMIELNGLEVVLMDIQ